MKRHLNPRQLRSSLSKAALSLVWAGVTYFIWMGLFILTAESLGSIAKGILWGIAPIVTALGFAVGVYTHERRSGERQTSFVSVLVWPLFGCIVGALVVVWRGPMLIVFGMFVVGTAGVVLREVIFRLKES